LYGCWHFLKGKAHELKTNETTGFLTASAMVKFYFFYTCKGKTAAVAPLYITCLSKNWSFIPFV